MIGNYFWGGGGAAPYEIEQSLRFNSGDNAYLSRTFGTGGSSVNFTISLWAKKASNDDAGFMLLSTSGTAGSGRDQFYINSAEKFQFYGSSQNNEDSNNVLLRDPSAWYHIVVACDMDNGTATDRIKVFYNGQRQASVSTSITSFSFFGGNRLHYIGTENDGVYNNGYIAEYHYIDGTTKDATDFGEYDDNGVWRPIEYTGSYGTNGFYLKFDPSATNGIGHDHSGNGNNWTANNFTTSGTGTDVMSDTPTNNYCTLDPINVNNNTSALAPSNGNLDLTAHFGRFGTIAVTSGKWYWEVTLTGTNSEYNYYFGAQNVQKGTVEARMMCNGGNTPDGNNISGNSNGTKTQPTGSRPSLPATIGVKLDMDNGDIEFVQGGVVNGKVTGITNWNGAVAPYISSNTTTFNYKTATFNFGQRAFANTIPTGYSALSTANLPAPDIADGSDYFQAVLYQGNDPTGQDITVGDNLYQETSGSSGNTWQPDLVWVKARGAAYWHRIYDAVRGATKELYTNDTSAETTDANALTSFNSDGFTLGSDQGVNQNNYNFVSWNWRAANSTETLTAGSIESTVSANPSAGFSIVTYTGNATAGATIAHGLGVKPKWMIVRQRNAASHWAVYTETEGAGRHLLLNSANAAANSGTNNYFTAEPTSTLFTVGSNGNVNANNGNMLAYCFAEVEGYSKFGSYTGNGNTDGTFVYCGFKPAFILIKGTGHTSNWRIMDDQREGYNPSNDYLRPNATDTEASSNFDILSNGFKLRNTDGEANSSSNNFVFAAFASSPFGGSGVSPATAR